MRVNQSRFLEIVDGRQKQELKKEQVNVSLVFSFFLKGFMFQAAVGETSDCFGFNICQVLSFTWEKTTVCLLCL